MCWTFLVSLILTGKFSRIARVLSHPGLASPTTHSLAFVPPLFHPTSSIFESFFHQISSIFRFLHMHTPDLVTNHYSICLSLAHLPTHPVFNSKLSGTHPPTHIHPTGLHPLIHTSVLTQVCPPICQPSLLSVWAWSPSLVCHLSGLPPFPSTSTAICPQPHLDSDH